MTEVKGVKRGITKVLDDLRNRRSTGSIRGKLKIEKDEEKKNRVSIEHKEEIQVIFRKSMDLLISSLLNNIIINNNNNNK
jgi:hypothetical protein